MKNKTIQIEIKSNHKAGWKQIEGKKIEILVKENGENKRLISIERDTKGTMFIQIFGGRKTDNIDWVY